MLTGSADTIRRARRLRKAMSLPEVLLWQELRKRPGGLKFRRQQAAGPYVGDFYCHQADLLIEIDGESHSRGNAPQWDAKRDSHLKRQGVTTIRIPARDVLENLEGTVSYIVNEATRMITPPPSSGSSRSGMLGACRHAAAPSPEGEDR
jgi:very-short-patch-repair endonuclease